MSPPLELRSLSPRQTLAFGRRLGAVLQAGDFVALSGPLGTGKTLLVRGIARGLQVPAHEPVLSPSFVLLRQYVGRLKLYHLDAYRLRNTAELLALGLEELRDEPDSVIALEWAERVPGAVPQRAWRLELEHAGPTSRHLRLVAPSLRRRSELARRLGELSSSRRRRPPASP